MTRLTLILAALLCVGLSAVVAAAPEKAPRAPAKGLPAQPPQAPATPAKATEPPATPEEEYVLTPKTEVLLDGRPCKYDDVPDRAVITQLDLADDDKTILKIHFRTKSKAKPAKPATSR